MSKLPKGMDSVLGKEFDEDGIELSGGENQKLAIARALYENAGVLILDEPANSLDHWQRQRCMSACLQQEKTEQ